MTLTKSWLQKAISDIETMRDEIPFGLDEDGNNTLDALKLALAGMEAEPVAVVDIQRGRGDGKKYALCFTSAGHSLPDDVYNLYTAPQPLTTSERAELENYRNAQQVVPEWTNEQCLEFLSIAFRHAEIKGDLEMDDIRLGVKMVNACRAAMLQAGNHAEQHLDMVGLSGDTNEKGKDGTLINECTMPVTQIKPVADLYGITSPTGSETTFTFDAGEASSFAKGGWTVQEYVELERYQEAVAGNSPVTPDGCIPVSDHSMLPPLEYLDTVKFNADCAIQDPESIYTNEFFLSLDEVFGEMGNYSEPVQAKAVSMLIAEVFRLRGYSRAAPHQEAK